MTALDTLSYPTMYREVIQSIKAKIEKARGVLYVHTTRIEDEGSVYWIASAEGDNPMYPDHSGSQFRTIATADGSSEIDALDKLAARLSEPVGVEA